MNFKILERYMKVERSMKRSIMRLILRGKGGKQHCLPFCWFQPGGSDTFEKEGLLGKWCAEIED